MYMYMSLLQMIRGPVQYVFTLTSCPPLKIVEGLLIVFGTHGVGAVANRGTCAGNRRAV